MELVCVNDGREIVGKGILMYDPTQTIDWQTIGVPFVIHSTMEGEERQSLALHLTCFADFFEQAMRREDALIVTVIGAHVGDLKGGLEENGSE